MDVVTIKSWIAFILSIIITIVVCSVINRNTIGTLGAYATRAFIVWIIAVAVLFNVMGLT